MNILLLLILCALPTMATDFDREQIVLNQENIDDPQDGQNIDPLPPENDHTKLDLPVDDELVDGIDADIVLNQENIDDPQDGQNIDPLPPENDYTNIKKTIKKGRGHNKNRKKNYSHAPQKRELTPKLPKSFDVGKQKYELSYSDVHNTPIYQISGDASHHLTIGDRDWRPGDAALCMHVTFGFTSFTKFGSTVYYEPQAKSKIKSRSVLNSKEQYAKAQEIFAAFIEATKAIIQKD